MAVDFSKYAATSTPTGSVDFAKYGTPLTDVTTEQTPQNPSYIERVGQSFLNNAQDIVKAQEQANQTFQNTGSSFFDELRKAGALTRVGLRTAGGIVNAAFSPITELPGIKQAVEAVAGAVTHVPGAGELVKKTADLALRHPEIAKDAQNIFDIATLGAGSAFEKPAIQEAGAIGSDVANLARTTLTPSESQVQNKVVSLFNKSIKPTPKKTTALADRYTSDVLNALRTIKDNSPNLNIEDAVGEITSKTPQTINELSQAVDQTKKLVFDKYDQLAKDATGKGASITTEPIAAELDKVAGNTALQFAAPEIIKYAENWAKRLRDVGSFDAQTAQEIIKVMNNNLSAFYRNPTYESASKVTIDAGIANNLRAELDKAIEGAGGAGYQDLKRQYGALKAIENDVVRASMRDAKRNAKGLLDYTDILTSGQMAAGILSLNPAMFTKGALERGFKEYIKYLNDPNRAVSNIFNVLDRSTPQTFTPKSQTFKSLKNPSMGLSIKDVSKDLQPLAQEAAKYKTAEEFVKAIDKTKNEYGGLFDRAAKSMDFAEKGFTSQLTDLWNKVHAIK